MNKRPSSRPTPSSEVVLAVMKRVRTKDTAPEMTFRKLLFSAGLRYRGHYNAWAVPLGGANIDIAFPGSKLAFFVDGCFWHACPDHGTIAESEWELVGRKTAKQPRPGLAGSRCANCR